MQFYKSPSNVHNGGCLQFGILALKVAYFLDFPGQVAYKLAAYKNKKVYSVLSVSPSLLLLKIGSLDCFGFLHEVRAHSGIDAKSERIPIFRGISGFPRFGVERSQNAPHNIEAENCCQNRNILKTN